MAVATTASTSIESTVGMRQFPIQLEKGHNSKEKENAVFKPGRFHAPILL
jgi:hypothetical protein